MKVRLEYKEGVVYQELPDAWHSQDRIYMPRKDYPTVFAQNSADMTIDVQHTISEHAFQTMGFEKVNGELIKVFKEI